MTLTEQLCRELEKFLGEALVKCYTDTISYYRHDAYELMTRLHKELYRVYYNASLFVSESEGTATGDVVVPLEILDDKKTRLKSFGCAPVYVHEYPEHGTAHVHIEDCDIKGRIKELAELLSS
jgi:hypothetical protein